MNIHAKLCTSVVSKLRVGHIHLFLYIRFYWNAVTPICYGSFHATRAELSSCDLQSLKYLLSGPLQKKNC